MSFGVRPAFSMAARAASSVNSRPAMPVRRPIREMPRPLMIASFSTWLIGHASVSSVYFCNDSPLECTSLVMPDDAPPALPGRMLPKLDEHNRVFWTGGGDGRLMIARSTQCALWVHPPPPNCPDCDGALVAQTV